MESYAIADSCRDHYEAFIQDPIYVGADVGGLYDWDLVTVPQTQLDGAARPMPQGKVLGGGSILNAMCWNRGGADDFDTWEDLGNPGWGWYDMLPYFMKVSHLLNLPYIADRPTRVRLIHQYPQKKLRNNIQSTTILLSMAALALSKSVIPDTFILSRVSIAQMIPTMFCGSHT